MMEWFVKAIEKAIEIPLDDAFGFFFCTLAGVIVNWIWKCKKEGIKLSSYWLDDVKSTFWVFAGAFAAFLTTVVIEPGVGKATYFAIGIAADSMIGKPPMPMAVRTALERLQASAENAATPVIVDSHGAGMSNVPTVESSTADAIAEIGKAYVGSVPPGQTSDKPSAT